MPDRVPKPAINWKSLAEERIRAAQAEGLFDCLPGFGQPIPGLDEPHDDLWWVKNKLKEERLSVLPPALEIRLDVERTLARLTKLELESQVRQEVTALNERIRKASFANVSGPSLNVMPLDVDEVVARWRDSGGGKV